MKLSGQRVLKNRQWVCVTGLRNRQWVSVMSLRNRQPVPVSWLRNRQSSLFNSAKLDDILVTETDCLFPRPVMETDCLFHKPVTETHCLFLRPVTETHCLFFSTLYSDNFIKINWLRGEGGQKQTFLLEYSVQEGYCQNPNSTTTQLNIT